MPSDPRPHTARHSDGREDLATEKRFQVLFASLAQAGRTGVTGGSAGPAGPAGTSAPAFTFTTNASGYVVIDGVIFSTNASGYVVIG